MSEETIIGRVCIITGSKKILEFQSGKALPGQLIKNAIASGVSIQDVEEKEVTLLQYNELLGFDINKPPVHEKSDIQKLVEYAKTQGWI